MESQLIPSIKVLDTVVHKMLSLKHPTDILKSKLDQMESLVMQIPDEQSELATHWANKLAIHWTHFESFLPSLQVPTTDSSPLSVQPQTVRFRAPQTDETNNVHDSRGKDLPEIPLKSKRIERPLTPYSDCNAQDLNNKHEDGKLNAHEPPSNLYGHYDNDYQPSASSTSSSESAIDQEYSAKQTSKFSIKPAIPSATLNKNCHAHNSFVERTSQNLYQSIAPSPSALSKSTTGQETFETKRSRTSYGHYKPFATSTSASEGTIGQECPSKQTPKLSTKPIISLKTSNKNGHFNSFVGRPQKRTLQDFDQSVAPTPSSSSSSSSLSLHQQPKRSRNVIEEIRLKSTDILTACRPVGANDIEGLKGLLRSVHNVIDHLNCSSMYSNRDLQLELFQRAFNKLPESIRAIYLESAKVVKNDLKGFKYFIKGQILDFLGKVREENAIAFSMKKASTTEPTSAATLNESKLAYCIFCKRTTNHMAANCPVKDIIKGITICFYCLEDGHSTFDCPNGNKKT